MQLSYYLHALLGWRNQLHSKKPGRPECGCECICCRNNHEIARAQLKSCTCVPASRVKDTIFYRRDNNYDAETIKGCASMFAYRFLPNRKYIVHIRQYACETCPGCAPTRGVDRYQGCINLETVRAQSYKCAGHTEALKSHLSETAGWVEHHIRPISTTPIAGTRVTNGLGRTDHRSRLEYVGKMKPGDHVFMANTASTAADMTTEFRPRNFWIAQLLPSPEGQSVRGMEDTSSITPRLCSRYILL